MSVHPHIPRVAPALTAADSPDTSLVEHVSYDPVPIDPHGFDTSDYDWVPVKRKPRPDGWSNEKQRAFIGHLADEGSVATAARNVGMSVQSCYRLRRAPGAENFARAWDAAIGEAGKRLLDIAFERATIGAEEPVFDKDGQVIAIRNRPSDRMLIFLLRTKLGDRLGLGFAQTAEAGERPARHADAPTPALPSVAQAMIALEPAQPQVPPHLSMTSEDLAHVLRNADLADGELPHWLRDKPVTLPRRGPNGLAARVEPAETTTPASSGSQIDSGFEQLLVEAKQIIAELRDRPGQGDDDDEDDLTDDDLEDMAEDDVEDGDEDDADPSPA